MRYFMQILSVSVMFLCTGTACADLGDQLFKLLANDGARSDAFGHSIAIGDGIVAVGAYWDDDNGELSGSAYLFDASTGKQIAKLLPNDGAADDWFGYSVAIENGIVAVGAAFDDDNGRNSGSVYLFDAESAKQIAKLNPEDSEGVVIAFGISISMDNGIIAIGAPSSENTATRNGSAYLFDASTGKQIAKLRPTDGGEIDRFGWSIDMDKGIVAIGAYVDDDNGEFSGSAYLFNASTGEQIAKLFPDDGAADDWFGYSIAIDNMIVAVGSHKHDDYGINTGTVYLFDASTGEQITKIQPDDVAEGDNFGISIAAHSGIFAIGAYDNDDSGSAYLFDAATGAQIAKLIPDDGEEQDKFGFSIAIDKEIIAVGAFKDDDNGRNSGSAYIFDATISSNALLTNFNVVTGALLVGDLSDLESSDDTYIHTRSGFGITFVDLHSMEMIVSATTTVDSASTIDLTIESRIDEPSGLAQIRMRNWNTNQFVSVGSYSLGNTDNIDTIEGIDATNYVDGSGNIDLSIKHLVFVPFFAFTFESFIDQVEIVVE